MDVMGPHGHHNFTNFTLKDNFSDILFMTRPKSVLILVCKEDFVSFGLDHIPFGIIFIQANSILPIHQKILLPVVNL